MAKLCLVTHFFSPHIGGIEKVAEEQAKRLSKMGYEVSVLTSKTHKKAQPRADGIKIFCYPTLGLAERIGVPYPIPMFRAHQIFEEVIRKSDIVHAHGHPYLSSLVACKTARKYKKPFILTQHNTFIDFRSWLNVLEHLNDWTIGNAVLKKADRITVVSKKTMEYVLKLGANISKTSVIYNGVDTGVFHPRKKEESRDRLRLPKNKTLILTVRRLVYKNGLNTLIDAASLLKRDHHDLLFLIIGNGPDKALIEKRAKELNIRDNVMLTGFVQENLLPLYYNAADYFVIPSSSGEGLPMVLLEAMACGLPIITTNTGGTPEAVENMKNGVLVPPRNPKALAQAISKLLGLPHKSLKVIGTESRKTVEKKFSWDENVRRLNEIYEELL